MRILSGLVLLLLLAVAGLWIGGETWLAGRIMREAEANPGLQVAATDPMRRIDRIGVRLDEASYQNPRFSLALPWLELWVAPLSLTTAQAGLPDQAMLRHAGRDHALGVANGALSLRLAPLHGGAVARASVDSGPVTLDAQGLADRIALSAAMTGLGPFAPAKARSAYDMQLGLQGIDPDALVALGMPSLALPGKVSIAGPATVWLNGIVGPRSLDAPAQSVWPVGIRSTGVDMRIGELRARLAGFLWRGDHGRIEGRLAIYTEDASALLRQASDAGLIASDAAMLVSAPLNGIGRMPFPDGVRDDGLSLPEPAEGELRLPVTMKDGRLFLGDIEIGAAPLFPLPQ